MRVAKMEAFELKSAESVRSNTAQRDMTMKESQMAEAKVLAAELTKLRCEEKN
jgi:hypothetical protein